MASNWCWLTVEDALAIHEDQIARFGGAAGLISLPLLESAMSAPIQFQGYTGEYSVIRVAAHMAHAIAKNHAFVDGNKRTATIAFLEFSISTALRSRFPTQPITSLWPSLSSR